MAKQKKLSVSKKLKSSYSPKPRRSGAKAIPLVDEVSESPDPATESPSPGQ